MDPNWHYNNYQRSYQSNDDAFSQDFENLMVEDSQYRIRQHRASDPSYRDGAGQSGINITTEFPNLSWEQHSHQHAYNQYMYGQNNDNVYPNPFGESSNCGQQPSDFGFQAHVHPNNFGEPSSYDQQPHDNAFQVHLQNDIGCSSQPHEDYTYLLELEENFNEDNKHQKKAEDVIEVYEEFYQYEDELVQDYVNSRFKDPGIGADWSEMPTGDDDDEPIMIKLFQDNEDIPDDVKDFVHKKVNSVVQYIMNIQLPSPRSPPLYTRRGCSRHNSETTGGVWIHELLNGNSTTFYWQMRMKKRMFVELHQLLVDEGGLCEGKTSTVSTLESLAIFMRVVARGCKSRDLENRFQHSTETIHRHFTKVLNALCVIAPKLITPPDWETTHPKISGDKDFDEYFKDCVGAIDGTHVNACVRACFKDRYRDRNGKITQNVLIACDFDGIITYVLPGWEGSAHDAAVLDYAMKKDKRFPNPAKAPVKGKYFLVDSGYANKPGFLAPHRRTLYHLPDWERHVPRSRMEYFNKKHARLRNVIERVNGQLKSRFPILSGIMYYGYSRRTQAKLVVAACVIHNFIKKRSFAYRWRDVIFDRTDEQLNVDAERHRGEMFRDDLPEEEYPNNIHNAMDEFRDELTNLMWARRYW